MDQAKNVPTIQLQDTGRTAFEHEDVYSARNTKAEYYATDSGSAPFHSYEKLQSSADKECLQSSLHAPTPLNMHLGSDTSLENSITGSNYEEGSSSSAAPEQRMKSVMTNSAPTSASSRSRRTRATSYVLKCAVHNYAEICGIEDQRLARMHLDRHANDAAINTLVHGVDKDKIETARAIFESARSSAHAA